MNDLNNNQVRLEDQDLENVSGGLSSEDLDLPNSLPQIDIFIPEQNDTNYI